MTLTIDIDGEMAAELNQFRPKLEATLILHVGLGKDHFVPVSANYGTFGRSPTAFLYGGPLCLFPSLSALKDLRELLLCD